VYLSPLYYKSLVYKILGDIEKISSKRCYNIRVNT
jgi:hypothetical protein